MLILIGESGSGKSTLETLITGSTKMKKVVSWTTRPQRNNEVDGIDYTFSTEDEFKTYERCGGFVEVETYNGWLYGLPRTQCRVDRVAVLTPDGYKTLRQYIKEHKINLPLFAIYIKVDEKSRLTKLLLTREDKDECRRRVKSDKITFKGAEQGADMILENFQYEYTPEELYSVIREYVLARRYYEYL